VYTTAYPLCVRMSVMPALDLEAIPPFMYQLLLLASTRFTVEPGTVSACVCVCVHVSVCESPAP